MSEGAAWLDFEEPVTPGSEKKKGWKKKPKKKNEKAEDPKPAPVPKLPTKEIVPLTGDEIKRGVSQRSRSAANLKVEGYSYAEIADVLEFDSPGEAKRAVESVLAAIHGPGDYETLRLIATSRAEDAFRRSTAMAKAHFLVLEDGTEVTNSDQLRWHAQAGADLMNWVNITGAKAPTKLEITPGDAEMDRLLGIMLERTGYEEVMDAEVIELTYIPAEPEEDGSDVAEEE